MHLDILHRREELGASGHPPPCREELGGPGHPPASVATIPPMDTLQRQIYNFEKVKVEMNKIPNSPNLFFKV